MQLLFLAQNRTGGITILRACSIFITHGTKLKKIKINTNINININIDINIIINNLNCINSPATSGGLTLSVPSVHLLFRPPGFEPGMNDA